MDDLLFQLIKTYKEIEQIERKKESLLLKIKDYIKESGFRDDFIINKIGMERGAFYRRMKKPSLWTLDELQRLQKILTRD